MPLRSKSTRPAYTSPTWQKGRARVRYSFGDIIVQPRRELTSPTWSGILNHGRAYCPYTMNVERLIPWRTLTGRQQFYMDHELYLAWGEHLPTYKPKPLPAQLEETEVTENRTNGANGMLLNLITPHGKWSIHSTYSDTGRMMTLSRGCYPVWLNDRDAAELDIVDNDWVEVHNDNGVFVQRAIVSGPHPARHSVDLSRDRANDRRAEIAGPRQAGRHEQLAHPGAAQARADGRRLCPIHLPVQLLGANGAEPRYFRLRAPHRPAGVLRGEHERPSANEHALPPG